MDWLIDLHINGECIYKKWAATKTSDDLSMFLQNIIMNAKLWMMFLDTNQNVVIWNYGATEISGYSSDDVLGNNAIWGWIYPEINYRKEVTRKIRDIIRNKKALDNFETKILTKRGGLRNISWNTRELTSEDGTCRGYIVIGNDITEKVLAKKEVKEREVLFYSIAHGANDAFVLLDIKGLVKYWNQGAETLFGAKMDTVSGASFFSLFSPPELLNQYTSDFRNYYESHTGPFTKSPIELQMQNSRGEILHLEMSLSTIHVEGTWHALGIFRDISSRIKTEQEEREFIQNAMLQGSPIPQFMIDKNHHVIFWNKALEAYSGIKARDVIKTDQQWRAFYDNKRPCLADLIIDNKTEDLMQWYGEKLKKSRLVDDAYEATDFFPKMGKDGVWLFFTAVVIRDLKGNIIGALETLEDRTDTMLVNSRQNSDTFTGGGKKFLGLGE